MSIAGGAALGCTQESHAPLKRDPIAWSALPLLGEQVYDFGDGDPPMRLQLRNCNRGCHSTLAVELPRAEAA